MPLEVRVVQGSLTSGAEDVLVNASNTNVQLGSGVSAAIAQACGGADYQRELSAALQARHGGPMAPGQVLVTSAGTHPTARFVAHVAVMDYRAGFTGTSHPTLDTIRAGCEALWDAVHALPGEGPLSVAMVALGAGTGGLGLVDTTAVAAQTLKAHHAIVTHSRVQRVVFHGYALHEFLAMKGELRRHFPSLQG